jgi:hypothetical protein
MMTRIERIRKTIRGEMANRIPYVPRLDLWHNTNALADTLLERLRGKSPDQICRAEGWALHKGIPDFANQPEPDAMLPRVLGLFSLKEQVFSKAEAPGGRMILGIAAPDRFIREIRQKLHY